MNIHTLVDYKEVYGEEKKLDDALSLLTGIPSITLINYISGFAVNLYLNENSEHSEKIQRQLLNELLGKAGNETIEKFNTALIRQIANANSPTVFWSYSNLLYYNLIFKIHNSLFPKDLTEDEAKKAFDAYLIIKGTS